MKRMWIVLLALVMTIGFSAQADATLQVIGTADYDSDGDGATESYKLIYDSDAPFGPIVWLDYTNSISTLWEPWPLQNEWAEGLNNADVLSYNFNPGVTVTWTGEWRLPATVDGSLVYTDNPNYYNGTGPNGYNITTSEMGHLFYGELGNLGYYDTSGNYVGDGNWGLLNTGDFDNLQPPNSLSWWYWSGTAHTEYSYWFFNFYSGGHGIYAEYIEMYGIAVRPAEVVIGPTPEEQIEDILRFFDDAVSNNILVGNGTTPTSSSGKLKALNNMLFEAGCLIGIGDIQGACTQLHDAYEKTDGEMLPPDFVVGAAAEELAMMIQDLMDSLGCE